MGTLKRPKLRRDDQSELFGKIKKIPTNTELPKTATAERPSEPPSEPYYDADSTDEGPANTTRFQRSRRGRSTVETYGRFVQTWTKPASGPIVIDSGDTRRVAYLSRNMLVVEVLCHTADMPDMLLCRFVADEWPTPVRECWLLTVDVWERVCAKCVEAERAWERGELPDLEYQTMRQRHAAAVVIYERLPKVWTFFEEE